MIKKSFSVLTIVCGVFFSWGMLASAYAQEALATRVIDDLERSTLEAYTSMVVNKLQQDGTGASADYTKKQGFAPLPKAFMRRMTIDTIRQHKRSGEKRFKFTFATDSDFPRFIVKMKEQGLSGEQEAEITVKAIDVAIRSIRTHYAGMVVRKLKGDGAGAAIDYENQPGFVPLPAVFIRHIISTEDSKSEDNSVAIFLRSRWNLNKEQGLQDAFEQEGWDFLVKQQEDRLASGRSLKKMLWKPYAKVVTQGDKKTFRYLSADPAANQSCVACHNQWENKKEIKALRKSQGIEAGKVFKEGELMGVLSIMVPLEN